MHTVNERGEIDSSSDSIDAHNLPIANNATILTTTAGGSHSDTKASTAYWAKERQIMDICDGLSTSVETQLKRKAGAGPNASIK